MTELLFLHSARRLMLVDACIKFQEYSLSGFQVIERFTICDRQTDRQTNGCPGKNYMSPDPKGGRHNDAQQTLVHQKGCYTCQWLDNVDKHLIRIYHVFPVL